MPEFFLTELFSFILYHPLQKPCPRLDLDSRSNGKFVFSFLQSYYYNEQIFDKFTSLLHRFTSNRLTLP